MSRKILSALIAAFLLLSVPAGGDRSLPTIPRRPFPEETRPTAAYREKPNRVPRLPRFPDWNRILP